MAEWYLGTMGFGYKDWQGVFYPPALESRNFLGYYSRIFDAVEIDSSFYGTPRESTIQRWLAVTPADFRFCLKTPQEITHKGDLAGSLGSMRNFLTHALLFGEKLGAVLMQFPPSFTQEQAGDLAEFLSALHRDVQEMASLRLAVEFRHPSWYTAAGDSASMLARFRACWAATEFPNLPREVPLTSDFLYIRWIGQHGSYDRHTHIRDERATELAWWWAHLQPSLDKIQSIFGFFNNDYAGFAPGSCNQFKSISGMQPVDFTPPQQPRLFDL